MPHLFGLADAVVNATRGNAADKVVYEAAASCLPVFAASPVFDTLLPEQLRFHGDYPGSLAEKIRDYSGGAGPELRDASPRSTPPDTGPTACWRSPADEAARALRLPRAVSPAARRAQKRKWDAVAEVVDHRVLAAAPAGLADVATRASTSSARPRRGSWTGAVLRRAAVASRAALRDFQPDAAFVQGVHEAAAFLIARRARRAARR